MAEARIHPPSEQRLSEARRQGHVPRAPLVGLFATWAALLLGLSLAAPSLMRALAALLRLPLEASARGHSLALAELWHAAGLQLVSACALVLLFAFAALALGTLIAQGTAFGFALDARLCPPPLALGRTARGLFALGLPIIALQLGVRALRAELAQLAPLLRDFALYAAAYLAACALLDAALARAAHVRSLWLTHSEHKQEQREAYGSPEVRRVRDRLRRELGRGAAP
jgi:type III secretory pathway component EscU